MVMIDGTEDLYLLLERDTFIFNSLLRYGINTVEKLNNYVCEGKNLMSIRNIGAKSQAKILRCLMLYKEKER